MPGLLLVLASAATAQFMPPGAPSRLAAPAEAPASDPGSTPRRTAPKRLIDDLKDDASRSGLLPELDPAADPAQTAAPQPAVAIRPTISERIVKTVPAAVGDLARDMRDIWYELRVSASRLGGLSQIDAREFNRLLRAVAPVAALAIAVYLLARRLAQPLFHRLGAGADRSRMLRTTAMGVGAALLDYGTVAVGAIAGAIGLVLTGIDDRPTTTFQIVFLAAFLVAGALLVAVRAIFSPTTPRLRPLPIDDAGARYWSRWLGLVAVVVAFSELFLRALVTETVSPLTAHAALVAIYVLTGLFLVGLIVRNRHAPAAHFGRRAAEDDDDLTFAVLAVVTRYWHYAAIVFLLLLMHQVVTSGGGALPLIFAAAKIVAAFALGAIVLTALARLGDHGVALPSRLTRALPAMEGRINTFVPAFLRLARLVILVLWIGFTLQVAGLVNFRDWLEIRVGVDVLAAGSSVLLIVLFGFAAWLALSSWVDYRLEPRRGRPPTSRERTLLSLLRNAATVVILLIGLMFILSELGISIAPLIASAGVLGLAIGFGAQKMVEDIIGGIFIQFENAINVGDVVSAAGTTGVVESLTIRSVALRDLEGVFHVIPFSAVSTVSNFTKGFGYHVADIGVAYRENIDAARVEMLEAFDALKADPELGPKLIGGLEWFGIEELGESTVKLRARLKTWPGEQWTLGRAYNEQIKKRFDAAGIEIAFPQLTLWFGEAKDGSAPPARLDLTHRGSRAATAPQPPTDPGTRDTRIQPGSPTDAPDHGAGDGPGEGGSDR